MEASIGTGARVFDELIKGLSTHTGYALDLSNLSHDPAKIKNDITSKGTPTISLRTWANVNGTWTWSWHYRLVCGIQQSHTETTVPVLWWTELRISDSYYYLMHDNTADGSVMNPSAPYY